MRSGQATWKHVWAEVRARQRELGWTDVTLCERCDISQTTYTDGRQDGKPLKRIDKITSLERGLGWLSGSVDAILAGGEPTVQEVSPTDDVSQPGGDVPRRVEQLEQDLETVREEVAGIQLVLEALGSRGIAEARRALADVRRRAEEAL